MRIQGAFFEGKTHLTNLALARRGLLRAGRIDLERNPSSASSSRTRWWSWTRSGMPAGYPAYGWKPR